MRYRFGAFELDDELHELRDGAGPIHIEPRVLDLLVFLLRNRDRVVTREELFGAVWKTQCIGEAALSRCIMLARKAITAPGSAAELIKTIHRRGYRFVAPVEEMLDGGSALAIGADAEKLYARAIQLWKKRSPGGMRSAIALLQEAIELEPAYAAAYALLGDCYLFIGFLQQGAPMSVYPKALAAIERAVELDPLLAESHAARGFIESVFGWNPSAARDALATAIRIGPRLAIAHHRLGLHLLTERRFDEAEASLRQAAALDRLSPIFATACGLPAMGRGEPARALPIYRDVIESEPSFYPVHFYRGLACEAAGRIEEAVESFRFAVSVAERETEALPALAHALAQSGQNQEAERIGEQLHEAAQQRFISPFFFAVVAMGREDYESALESLRKAVSIRAARMSDLHLDPRFRPLHRDPRFRELLAEIGMDPETTASSKWWAARTR